MRCRRYSKRYTLALTSPSRELSEDVQRCLACNPIRHTRAGTLYSSRERPSEILNFTSFYTLYVCNDLYSQQSAADKEERRLGLRLNEHKYTPVPITDSTEMFIHHSFAI